MREEQMRKLSQYRLGIANDLYQEEIRHKNKPHVIGTVELIFDIYLTIGTLALFLLILAELANFFRR